MRIEDFLAARTDGEAQILSALLQEERDPDRRDALRSLWAAVVAKQDVIRFHEQWPVLVETKPEFTPTDFNGNSYSMQVSQHIEWVTQQEYRRRFGSEPPTAPILRQMAERYADHPDYDPSW